MLRKHDSYMFVNEVRTYPHTMLIYDTIKLLEENTSKHSLT